MTTVTMDFGQGHDPWSAGRQLTETPEIDPSAVLRQCRLGRYTYIGPQCHFTETEFGSYSYAIGRNSIAYATIGRFCSLASDARINPGNHPLWRAGLHHFTYRSRSYGFALEDDEAVFERRRKDHVEIGPDAWIGHGAIVMPGVKIGAGAAVGAGAIVTKDVAPFAVVVGVPAELLRYRVQQTTAERLLRIAWWNWSHAELEAALPDFRQLDVDAFAEKYDR